MALERLPKYFKIKEDNNSPLMFYYYDERNPCERSCNFNNFRSLIIDCKKYAELLKWIENFKLPEGFKIELKIHNQIPSLYFGKIKIKDGDVFELEGIAHKNHSIYNQLKALNEGLEVEI